MALAAYIRKVGDTENDVTEKRIFHGFANALECVPRALIQNSSFPTHKVLSSWRLLYENQKQSVSDVVLISEISWTRFIFLSTAIY
jgi:chaperonin GroEL (HSP60 family)